MVARAKSTIAFLIHLHIVMMREKKNICSTENSSYHLDRSYVFVPVDVVKDVGELEIYFK